MKRSIQIVFLGLFAALAYLASGNIFPRTPKSTAQLKFEGIITLPRLSWIEAFSILDYMTISGNNLFVASIMPGAVYRIPLGAALPTSAQIAFIAGKPAAHGVVIDPVGGMGFISRSGTSSIDVFNSQTMKLVKRLPADADADAITYDAHSKQIYAGHGGTKTASLVDPVRQIITATVALDGQPEFAVYDSAAHVIYQNLIDENTVATIDTAAAKVIRRDTLSGCEGPSGMALDASMQRLFIACQKNASLVIFDLKQHKVIGKLAIGSSADSVAYDARLHRAYATGLYGDLSVIDCGTTGQCRSLSAIKLPFGAHSMVLDSQTNRLYIGYMSLFTSPKLAVFTGLP